MAAGYTQQFTATGTYSNGTTQNLTTTASWTSSNTSVATIKTKTGLATSVAQGTATITATSGAISGSATLTVTAAVLTSIAVTPSTASVPAGDAQQFTATGTYSNGTTQNLTSTVQWTSSATSVAVVSSAGLATSLAQGSAAITATSGTITGSAKLTVTAAVLTSIAVTPTTATVAAGYTQQFTATGTYSNGTTQNLTTTASWTSSNTSVATIKAKTGLATSVAQGTATITATSGSITGSATLTVTAPVLTSIAVTPSTASVPAGDAQQFTATGTYSNGTTQNLSSTVQWTSSATSIATVSSAGLATSLAQGSATITATAGAISGSATLTVTAAVLTSIAVTPTTASVAAGHTQQFTATGTYSNGTTQNLTTTASWTSSNTSVATIKAKTGLATSVAQGTATITATLGKTSGSATLTVTPAVLTSIAVAPSTVSVPAGDAQQFTATGTYSNGTTQNLTSTVQWTSSAVGVATVSSGGLAIGLSQGATSISASSGAISGSASLSVTPPLLSGISISPASASIAKGTTQQFTATGTYTDGSTQNLTATVNWSASPATVATMGSGGSATGAGIGTATITANSGTISATATLSVGQPVLVSMAVTPASPSFALGTTQPFAATGTYSDGSTLDLTNTASWSTADDTIATVNGQGLVTSVALGSTSVTATSGTISGSTTLTITPAVLVSIAVTPAIPTIPLGTTQPFTATGTYTDGSTQNITGTVQWSSDTPTVATISNATGSQGVASSVEQGTATISASVGAVTGSTTLTVTSAALVSLAITPVTPSLALGTTQQFTATGTYTDGSTQNLTSTATWSSDTPATATINNAGFASSVGVGTATITAASGSITSATLLTVTPAVLVSIAINPPTATVPLGVTEQFTATGTFTDGTTQDVTQSGHWSSTVATVATISNSAGTAGLATTLGAGTTTIEISSGGVSASAPLIVNPAVLASIAINPQAPTIALGTSQQFMATGTYTDGSTQDVTSVVTWGSSAATVAVISNSVGSYGLATSSGQGTATITATSGSITSSTTITVGEANVTSIAVTPSSISILLGAAEQFTATATYSDGSTQDITQSATWTSSNPTVATVSSTGLAMSMLAGTTSISASSDSATGTAVLTVNAPVPVSLQIAPANPTVSAGAQLQFDATLFYSDGSSMNVTSTVSWTSSNPAVATVGSTGLAASLTPGSSTIEANWGANLLTSTVSLTVDASNTFFVATNGNDAWSGQLSSPNSNNSDGPFASLSRAQYAVERAPKPATVMVRNGTYYLALTPSTANSYPGGLTFTSADSGSSSSSQVTWQNYPGETPVVSGGVPANADPISGVGLHLQWTNTGNWYQAQLPSTLPNNVAIQPFESLYYNGQRRLRSRIHDNGTLGYPSIGYFMQSGQCVASPSTPAGQQAPAQASCNLGTFLRVANTISPSSPLGQGCPYASALSNNVTVSKCLDRFVYANTAGGDAIGAWQNLNAIYSSNDPAIPCVPSGNSYPAGDVELTLFDAWSVDVMRVNCVDTAANVIFLLGPTKGGGTVASSDVNYNFLGPTVGHRYLIENTLDAFNDALTPSSSQYGITGIWFLDRHTVPWVLNYIANPGETPGSDSIVIPQLGGSIPGAPATDYIGGSLITANGLEYVTFQGIIFEVDNFYPNSIGFNNDGNGEMALPQAIDCENCQFVTFNSVTVAHTSASGILAAATAATPACSGSNPPACVVIENSTLYDIGDSGIRVGHTVSTSDTSATVVQHVLAQNNLIQGYSRVFADGEGIAEANGNNNQYSYNTITDGYHAAISICQGGCGPTKNGVSISGNNIITSYNLVSNIIQGITSDGGAVYYNVGNGNSSGQGDSIASNVINNITDSYIIDNTATAGVAVMGSAYGGEGIQLDAQTANLQATNNVIYNLSGYAIDISDGLASSKETENIFNNNIFAFANSGMFYQQTPWPNGCPASPIEQVAVSNNIFYFDRFSTSTPSFYVIQGCKDSCKQAYDTYQSFQGNSYWRTDGGFANDSNAFQVLTTQGLNSNNSCKTGPTTSLYFASTTMPNWQTGGKGVPVAMDEDLSPNATASYQPPFTGSGLTTDLPANYLFGNGQIPPTQFAPGNTNLTITNAHSSLPPVQTVPPTFPIYVYGSPLNKF
ncbi:MAG: Ig-like domain-containing protein [Candidatus Sulfotelmatobacter sp.]